MTLFSIKQRTVRKSVCHCAAYRFPHRLDSGKCRELYNESAKEQQDWDAYFAQRSVQDRQLHQSGHSASDF